MSFGCRCGSGGSSVGDGGFFVLGAFDGEKVLELPLQRLESGPLHGILVPALEHDLVQRRRTVGRCRHPVAVLHLNKKRPPLRYNSPCSSISIGFSFLHANE